MSKILKPTRESNPTEKITSEFSDLRNKAESCGFHVSLTTSRVEKAARESQLGNSYPGFCIACGAEAQEIEPDARACECERCGRRKVYGAEELLVMLVMYD